MPKVLPIVKVDGATQAIGKPYRSTRSLVYAVHPSYPLHLFELGGHGQGEAPTFNDIEASAMMHRQTDETGYNKTTMEYIDPAYTQSTDVTIDLPDDFDYTFAHQLVERQRETNKNYRFVILPKDPCADECDRKAQILEGVMPDDVKPTSGAVTFDASEGDGGVVARQMVVHGTGAYINQYGLKNQGAALEGLDEVTALLVAGRDTCGSSFCPHQVQYYADGDGVAVPAAASTDDKWGTTTAIDLSLLPAASYVTSILRVDTKIYFAYADAFKATSTTGGVAVSDNGAIATLIADFAASTGIQALLLVGEEIHAFGETGEWWISTDGINFTAQTAVDTDCVFFADFNPYDLHIYIAGEAGLLKRIDMQRNVEDLNAGATMTGALNVWAAGPDHIVVVSAATGIWDNTAINNGGSFVLTHPFILVSTQAPVIAGDRNSSIIMVGHNQRVWQRSIATQQKVVLMDNLADAIYAVAGGYSLHLRTPDYYVFSTSDGQIIEYAPCQPCVTPSY